MAALTANADLKRHGTFARVGSGGVAASTTIYRHGLLTLDGGVIKPLAGTSPNCVGFAKEKYDNSAGAASAVTAEFFYGQVVELASTGLTNGHIYTTVYGVDDATVDPNPTGSPAVGLLVNLVSGTAHVLIGHFDD